MSLNVLLLVRGLLGSTRRLTFEQLELVFTLIVSVSCSRLNHLIVCASRAVSTTCTAIEMQLLVMLADLIFVRRLLACVEHNLEGVVEVDGAQCLESQTNLIDLLCFHFRVLCLC